MLERDKLREASMKNRDVRASKNRKSTEDFIERKIMEAVYNGRTSVVFNTSKLRLMTFGDDMLLKDMLNSLKGRGLSVFVEKAELKKDDTIEVSWD